MARRRTTRYRLPRDAGSRGGRVWPRRVLGLAVAALVLGLALLFVSRGTRKPTSRGDVGRQTVVPPTPVAATSPPPVVPVLPVVPIEPAPPGPEVRVSTNLVRLEVPAAVPGVLPDAVAAGDAGSLVPAVPWVPRGVSNLLEAQVALAAHGISAGSIDGIGGAQTAAALRAFQSKMGLEQTGRLDRETQRALRLERPPFARVALDPGRLAELRAIPPTWLGKSRVDRLGFETALEMAAELGHAHPSLVRRLNPSIDWDAPGAVPVATLPDAEYPAARRAALVRVSLAGRQLRVFDERGGLLAHFPCSIGRIAGKRPVGSLRVAVVAKDPNYTFDPAVFPESAEARALGRKLVLPPGPNNPVGVAWIGLDRPGYGIHGTPSPEMVGRTESHGCFRLANWNAEYLLRMAWVGLPVHVEP